MTESCGASTGVPVTRIMPGSIGPAAGYNEVRLDRADRRDPGARRPNVFMGYLNLPEKTAETPRRRAAGCTPGTSARSDAEGYFRITDRMKDIIITAGGKEHHAERTRERTQVQPLRPRTRW